MNVSQAGVNQQHQAGLWGVQQAHLQINWSAADGAERQASLRVEAGEGLIYEGKNTVTLKKKEKFSNRCSDINLLVIKSR